MLTARVDRMRNQSKPAGDTHPAAQTQGKHVWVRGTTGWSPGLLVSWARAADRAWWGHVVVIDEDGDPAIMRIRADHLRPALAPPPTDL